MERSAILKPSLVRQFRTAMDRGHVVLFTAPSGFGKTTTAKALVAGSRVCALSAGAPDFTLPPVQDDWDTLLIDDL